MLLQERCEAVAAELVAAESALAAAEDVSSLRHAAMRHVASVSQRVDTLMGGAGDCDPNVNGMTTEEERALSHLGTVGSDISLFSTTPFAFSCHSCTQSHILHKHACVTG
jgi:hypothetical protein